MITPVILAGGSGTRLWPVSRSLYPKQFLKLTHDTNSLFQETILRITQLETVESSPPIVICNEEHRFLVAEQLRAINIAPMAIILEPVGRNTAPAIALAALKAEAESKLLVLPADHFIEPSKEFENALLAAEKLSGLDKLVTFGIKPSHPETGYGYIKAGDTISNSEGFTVDRFVEKPDLEKAKALLESGDFFWNSGMFLFKSAVYLAELKEQSTQIYDACNQSFAGLVEDLDFLRIPKEDFENCPSDSIDYAVMEKTKSAAVVPFNITWDDVGSWSSLWKVNSKNENNNFIKGDVYSHETNNSYVHADSRLVATIGLDNHIVVETADAVLVADKSKTQEVKHILSQLKQDEREETNLHKRVYRPWGWYESICSSDNFQVKRICVSPGASLSLQMHHHRAEHWVIVKGVAKVTNGDEVKLFNEDQSTYIPIGNKHRLENCEQEDLEIIEIQTGSYLGEDDIVRFEDVYGR